MSRDVWEDSGGNESSRSCLLSVRDACECLGVHMAMSGVISECLGISEGVLGVLEGVRGAQGVSGSILL